MDGRPFLRVLIVDGFVPVRQRLAAMLGELPGVEVVGEAGSVEETLGAIRALAPEVVVLDLDLTGNGGLEVLERTRDVSPRPLFIVLTSFPDMQFQREAARHKPLAILDKAHDFDKALAMILELAVAEDPGKPVGGLARRKDKRQ